MFFQSYVCIITSDFMNETLKYVKIKTIKKSFGRPLPVGFEPRFTSQIPALKANFEVEIDFLWGIISFLWKDFPRPFQRGVVRHVLNMMALSHANKTY